MTIRIRMMSRHVDIFHAHDFNNSLLSAIIGTNKAVISVFGADPLFEAFNYKRKSCINYEAFLKNRIIIVLQKIINAIIFIISGNRLTVISLNRNLNKIIKRYHRGPVANIPVGINLDLYHNSRMRERMETKSILVVSRFMPWKEIGRAIEIFMEVKRFNKEVEMILIGDGPMLRHYVAKYKHVEGLKFAGDMDYKKTIEYYKKSDIFLITSQYETFGITVIEAMATGLAVVASDLDVFRDRLIDNINCYLVSGGDTGIFTDRILKVLNNNNIRERFISNSFDIVRNYDIDKIRGSYINLYNNLSKS
jgi:glycosyltransferase involved in cell wall biosynthesis